MNRLLAVDKPPTCAGEWLMPPGLSDFLLARIAEDEEVARVATPSAAAEHPGMGWNPAAVKEGEGFAAIYGGPVDEAGYRTEDVFRFADEMDCEECVRPSYADMEHIARHDPARVLADCDVKRRIVDSANYWIRRTQSRRPDMTPTQRMTIESRARAAEETLRLLALPHAGHPDYNETWRP